ncbi:ribosomal protection-like ABC-F family protein [Alicyclobacillus fastidiosus]|uniref:ATP-binding cassette domain-containing protein n=1 Tax=Alicyclobacillus fastidiosus TaxID=392011 RepID=A0ABV5AE93_9BACL|nr:ATP-binding cassette domain-containing protein [Alicyclobacillus fastidiosus]WEH09872.1 ATP-binding cassette domain-containing protein [Alicyclobacillus fastidiosus]
MYVIRVANASKSWAGKPVFQQVSFELHPGEKLVLFGRNGVGKTTLLRALTGDVPLDGGTIARSVPPSEWGFLEQVYDVSKTLTVLDYALSVDEDLSRLRTQRMALERDLERGAASYAQPSVSDDLTSAYSAVLEDYLARDGYEWEAEVERTLEKFGLSQPLWGQPFPSLSGGQKTRLQLARIMLKRPRVLLLDEPTNHLDEDTMRWLEDWVRNSRASVIMVTHDRHFIDQVADATIELTAYGARRFVGGYTQMEAVRRLERETQQAAFEKEEKARTELMEAIRRYRQWFEKAHASAGERNPYLKKRATKNATRFQAKERALARLEADRTKRPTPVATAQVSFREGQFDANTYVTITDAAIGYPGVDVLQDVSLRVRPGDRIAVVGNNGSGKSTLLKVISGQLAPTLGEAYRHPALRVALFDQEVSRLDPDLSVLDTLLQQSGLSQSYARTILAGFLFRGDDVYQRVGQLSMGERCRVAFVRMYLSDANLLVLDEPTNYLDVETREQVETALFEYPGALVFVSHDRYLVKKLASAVIHVEDGRIQTFDGGYDVYLQTLYDPLREHPDRQRRIAELELRVTHLMSKATDDEGTAQELMAQIRNLQQEIEDLRRSHS